MYVYITCISAFIYICIHTFIYMGFSWPAFSPPWTDEEQRRCPPKTLCLRRSLALPHALSKKSVGSHQHIPTQQCDCVDALDADSGWQRLPTLYNPHPTPHTLHPTP